MPHRRWTSSAALLCLGALTGCPGDGQKPYASSAGIGTLSAPFPAYIRLSTPTAYSRESLVNERLRDTTFLKGALSQAEHASYVSQLQRDLVFISSTAANLGLSISPSLAKDARRYQEVSSARQEVILANLEYELAKVRKATNELAEGAKGQEGSAPTFSATGPKAPDTAAQITKLQTMLEATLTAVKALKVPDTAQIELPPEEVYAARRDFRAQINQDMGVTELDESHDDNGNALRRFQFVASIRPGSGEMRKAWGLAHVTIDPPKWSDAALRTLYLNWLGHVSEQLNGDGKDGHPLGTGVAGGLAASGIYFDVVRIPASQFDASDTSTELKVAVPKGKGPLFLQLIHDNETWKPIKQLAREIRQGNKCQFGRECSQAELAAVDPIRERAKELAKARSAVAVVKSLTASPFKRIRSLATKAADLYEDFLADALLILGTNAGDSEWYVPSIDVPPAFSCGAKGNRANRECQSLPAALKSNFEDTEAKVTVYRVLPAERAQRISSGATATQSLQAGLAAAAALAGSGIGAEASVSHLRSATGQARQIELVPQIIGFSEDSEGPPVAGWLFGPQAHLDTKANDVTFAHTAREQNVALEVSYPGWWPSLRFIVRPAWIGDEFASAPDTSKITPAQRIERRTAVTRSGLDDLSSTLLHAALNQKVRHTHIEEVHPQRVSDCRGDTTFLVRGSELWRNPEAYLAGQREKALSVLPDMGGLAITFDLSTVPFLPNPEDMKLRVWTRSGDDSTPIFISRDRFNGRCGLRSLGTGPGELVSPVKSYVVKGGELAVAITPKLADSPYAEAKLAVRPTCGRSNIAWTEMPVSLNDTTVKATLTIDRNPGANLYTAGCPLEVALLVVKAPNEKPAEYVAPRKIIYYPETPKGQFAAKTGPLWFPAALSLRLPDNYLTAFPDIVAKNTVLTAKLTAEGKDYPLIVTRGPWPTATTGADLKLEFATATDLSSLKGKDAVLTVTLDAGEDAEFFPVDPLPAKLK